MHGRPASDLAGMLVGRGRGRKGLAWMRPSSGAASPTCSTRPAPRDRACRSLESGRPAYLLHDEYAGQYPARRGSDWRIRYRVDEGTRAVIVLGTSPRSSLAGRHRLMIWWMQVPPSHCPVTDRRGAGSAADAMPAGVNVMTWPRSPTTGIPRAMGAPSAADGGPAPCVPVPFICGRLSRFSRPGSGVRSGSRRQQYRRRLRRGRAASPFAEAGRPAGPARQGRPR